MKKRLFLLVAALLAMGQNAFAYDFSAVAPSGQTLFYKIIDSTNHYVMLTMPNEDAYSVYDIGDQIAHWSPYSAPSGALVLPETVSYNGITYTVRAVGPGTFCRCPISSVVMSNTIDSLCTDAFLECSYLSSVTFSNSLRYIGFRALRGCILGDVVLPSSLRVLEGDALYLSHVTSITLNDSLEVMESNCLFGNPFTSLYIPASVRVCNGPCHDYSGLITSIVVDPANPYFDSRNNCNAIINSMNEVVQCCSSTVLPEGVNAVFDGLGGCVFDTFVLPASVVVANLNIAHCNKLIVHSSMLNCGIFLYGQYFDTLQLTSPVPLNIYEPYTPAPFFLDIPIIVPCGSLAAYQASEFWSQFTNIQEPDVPQITLNAEHGTATVEVYPTCGHDTVTVRATAEEGNWHFSHWSDGSRQNPYTLVLNGNTTLTAYFAIDSANVTATANPLKGAVLGGGTVPLGGTTTLTAIPSGNNIFLCWSNGVTDNPYTFTVTADTVLQALFTLPDTLVFRDTTYINQYVHDTAFVHDYVHDTTILYVNQYVHDTAFVHDYVHDTMVQYVNQYIYDTAYVYGYIHDTVRITTYVFDTTIVNHYQYDTTLNNHYQHDTVINNLYTFDTMIVNNHQYDTMIVNNYQYDTMIVNHYQYDTSIYNTYTYDTVIINNHTFDTVYVNTYDTVYVHDTVYVTEEGIGDVEALNAKVYSSHGQIVVEGADGNTVTLYDVTGRVLATKQDDYSPLRFDAPASGTYLIKIGNYPARRVVVIR